MPLVPNLQDFYKEIRDDVLRECGDTLALLKYSYDMEKSTAIAFNTTKRQYVEYLIATIVGLSLSIKTSPPLNVAALLKLHLQETKSYRMLERCIVGKFKRYIDDGSIEDSIDHSMVENSRCRVARLESTRKLFTLALGFEDFENILDTMEETEEVPDRPISERTGTSEPKHSSIGRWDGNDCWDFDNKMSEDKSRGQEKIGVEGDHNSASVSRIRRPPEWLHSASVSRIRRPPDWLHVGRVTEKEKSPNDSQISHEGTKEMWTEYLKEKFKYGLAEHGWDTVSSVFSEFGFPEEELRKQQRKVTQDIILQKDMMNRRRLLAPVAGPSNRNTHENDTGMELNQNGSQLSPKREKLKWNEAKKFKFISALAKDRSWKSIQSEFSEFTEQQLRSQKRRIKDVLVLIKRQTNKGIGGRIDVEAEANCHPPSNQNSHERDTRMELNENGSHISLKRKKVKWNEANTLKFIDAFAANHSWEYIQSKFSEFTEGQLRSQKGRVADALVVINKHTNKRIEADNNYHPQSNRNFNEIYTGKDLNETGSQISSKRKKVKWTKATRLKFTNALAEDRSWEYIQSKFSKFSEQQLRSKQKYVLKKNRKRARVSSNNPVPTKKQKKNNNI
jgi:hypothetical protein